MGNLRDAFDLSVESNRKVDADLDAALIEAGRKIAGRVDDVMEFQDEQEITKALYLLPHLMNILREMYATPKARDDAGIGKESASGKLAAVRQIRERPAPTKKRVAQ